MTEKEKYRGNPLPEEMVEVEPSSARLISTLGIAGFFSGLLLVAVYLVTLPIIEANKARALEAAIYKVLPGCATFETLQLKGNQLITYAEEAGTSQGRKNEEVKKIFAGYDESGKLVGLAINASEPGFQDLIVGIFGYSPENQAIIGFEVLESKETPGLGDKIIKDENFQRNFDALKIDPEIILAKQGQKQLPNEVESITGATISSRAVVRLLQNGMEEWKEAINIFMQEKENNAQ
jgi:electron transport complex protein RnfG